MFFNDTVAGFNIRLFLSTFLSCTLGPSPHSDAVNRMSPARRRFSNFIFGLRTGVSPGRHSQITFIQIYSNGFRGSVIIGRTQSNGAIQLSRPRGLFTRNHRSLRRTCPNSIVNLGGPNIFTVNSAVCRNRHLRCTNVPYFSPRVFTCLEGPGPSGCGRFRGNILRLQRRKTIRVVFSTSRSGHSPVLTTINRLRFRIIRFQVGGRCGMSAALRILPCSITH